MPLISIFEGIKIYMYYIYGEHEPPHVHAFYQGKQMIVDIMTLKIRGKSSLANSAKKKVLLWIEKHRDELMEIWTTQVFRRIEGSY